MRISAIIATLFATTFASQAFAAGSYLLIIPTKSSHVSLSVSLTGATLPPAKLNAPYWADLNDYLSITGKTVDYSAVTWSSVSGNLPEGLQLTSTGSVEGTPVKVELKSFEISAAYKNKNDSAFFSLDVADSNKFATAVGVGSYHACAIISGGDVYCWGNNDAGQVGATSVTKTASPIQVANLPKVKELHVGSNTTCALTGSNEIYCWGFNNQGQLGSGSTNNSATPVKLNFSAPVRAMNFRYNSGCAMLTTGDTECWGAGPWTTSSVALTPTNIPFLANAKQVGIGIDHRCLLTTGGGVSCWGGNYSGELGDGTQVDKSTPSQTVGLSSGVSKLIVGGRHSCVITTTNDVRCWGPNGYGQLGLGTNRPLISTVPETSNQFSAVQNLIVGMNSVCAITTGGASQCVGSNIYSLLNPDVGSNSVVAQTSLKGVPSSIVGIGLESTNSCALLADGKIMCLGSNAYGQLGNGNFNSVSTAATVQFN